MHSAIDPSPPAFLHIQPSRREYWEGESVSLSCEMQASDSVWILRKYRHKGISMSFPLEIESSGLKAVYNIDSLNISHDGNYWCQSESGELSNIVIMRVEGKLFNPKHFDLLLKNHKSSPETIG